MNQSRLEIKVGLFVFVGLALLAILLLQFSKGTAFLRPTYNIYLHAGSVGGLKPRAQILMSGVQIGNVAALALGPQGTNVTITLRIYSQYQIFKDARFVIEQSGFLGDQYVAILPTKNVGEKYTDGGEATAESPFDLQEVARAASGFIRHIDETARKLNETISDVRRLVLNEQTLSNLSTSAGNLKVASEHAIITLDNLNVLLATNSLPINVSVSNLVVFSEQLTNFAGSLTQLVATNSPEINVAVKNVESSTETLKSLLDDVHAGKGLAGELLRNETTASNVAQIAYNLSVTTSNLNRLGLWGILWQRKPARTNAHAKAEAPLAAPKNP
jgi:ABC-type transporter Mla subunit MlaD